jgi:DNA invertase Pin-like site-specific DNA recombinase
LLVESLDRLSRQNINEHLKLFIDILHHDINIATLLDNKVYTKNSDTTDFFISLASMARAHEESKVKSQRGLAAWKSKRSRAGILTKRSVAWVKVNDNNNGFELLDDRVDIIRRIFDEAANHGMGADLIARRLNKDEIKTFGKSVGWHKSYVQKILGNKAVIGEFQHHKLVQGKREPVGDPVKNYYPSVIDDDLFYKAQAARNAHKLIKGSVILTGGGRKGSHYSNLFTGLLRCPHCYGSVVFVNKGASNGSFLFCDNARRGIGSCSTRGWRYKDFESKFLRFVQEAKLGEIIGNMQPNHDHNTLADEVKTLQGKLVLLEKQRERTYQLVVGDENSEFAKKRFHELDAQIVESEKTLKDSKERLAQLNFKEAAFTQSKEQLERLVSKLQSSGLQDVFVLRAAVANHFHDIIEVIGVQIVQPRSMYVQFKDGTHRFISFGQAGQLERIKQISRLFDSDEDFEKGNSRDPGESASDQLNEAFRREIQTPEE